jgi:hypothetical protein
MGTKSDFTPYIYPKVFHMFFKVIAQKPKKETKKTCGARLPLSN